MNGKEFEDEVERLLKKYNIVYKREGEQVRRGGKVGFGKYDFDTEKYAIECKSIGKLNNLTFPFGIENGHVKIKKSPKVHIHQLRALRQSNKVNGLLIHESSSNRNIWLSTGELDRLVVEHGLFNTLSKGIADHLEINLEEFIKKISEV